MSSCCCCCLVHPPSITTQNVAQLSCFLQFLDSVPAATVVVLIRAQADYLTEPGWRSHMLPLRLCEMQELHMLPSPVIASGCTFAHHGCPVTPKANM